MSKKRPEVNKNFHGHVDVGYSNSAEYVIAHGARQIQRGRKPAVSYKGIANPRAALQAAKEDIEARASDSSPLGRTAQCSGRVAILHIQNEDQKFPVTAYSQALIDYYRAVGSVISLLGKDETPPQMHTTQHGTVELAYRFQS